MCRILTDFQDIKDMEITDIYFFKVKQHRVSADGWRKQSKGTRLFSEKLLREVCNSVTKTKQNAEDLRRVEAILFSMQVTSLYAMKIVKVVFLFVHLHKPFTKPNCTQILLFLLGQLESRQPVLYGVHTTEFLRDKFCYFNLTAISFYLAICFIYLIKQQLALRNYLK